MQGSRDTRIMKFSPTERNALDAVKVIVARYVSGCAEIWRRCANYPEPREAAHDICSIERSPPLLDMIIVFNTAEDYLCGRSKAEFLFKLFSGEQFTDSPSPPIDFAKRYCNH